MESAGESVSVLVRRLPSAADLPLPSPATSGSAGCDLHAAVESEVVLAPAQRELVPTGLTIALPPGWEGQVRPRSGLALRHGILLPNAPGTIDSDYRGEVSVILMNGGSEPFAIRRGDRIAQLVVSRVARVEFREVAELPGSVRGSGGFGHTGVASGKGEA